MPDRPQIAPPPLRAGPRRAFTLVELLVVIGIIAIVLAFLLPALGRSRQIAQATKCLAQIREVGVALQMYLNDNRWVLPPQSSNDPFNGVKNFGDETVTRQYPTVIGLLLPYLKDKQVVACPVASFDGYTAGASYAPTTISATSYMTNAVVCGRPVTHIPLGGSALIYLQENRYVFNTSYARPGKWGDVFKQWHWNSDGAMPEEYSNVHLGSGNVLYADGHAQRISRKDLRASDFGLNSGPGATGQPTDTITADNWRTYKAAF